MGEVGLIGNQLFGNESEQTSARVPINIMQNPILAHQQGHVVFDFGTIAMRLLNTEDGLIFYLFMQKL